MKPLLTPDEFRGKGRLLSHSVIFPGSSIGVHTHKGDFETYYILKGEGLVNDNGVVSPVGPGDVIYTGNKEEIEEETRNILDEAGTTGVVLGADCTIPRDTDVNHLAWVREAADRYGK